MSLDPFRNVHRNATEVIWDLARQLHKITAGMSPWIGSGWRPGSTEHATGRALDIIIADKAGTMPTAAEHAVGELVVDWLIRHAEQLHLRHLIYNKRIWKRRYRHTPTAWTALTGRKGISDWHQDHIHVYLDDAAGTVPDAPLITLDLEKELTDMDANTLAAAILSQKITANGKTDTIAQHFAEMVVATHAQSTAVATEARRDSASQQQLIDQLNEIEAKLEELTTP